ncbi:extensin family protein [Myxococcota bacterium]
MVGPPEPIEDCEHRLVEANVSFAHASLPLQRVRGIQCGSPQAVVYRSGPEKIRWRPPPLVSCGMALALAQLEIVVNQEARQLLGSSVASVQPGGTYSCRGMARFKLVSEHSYANAIDIYSLQLADGRRVNILRHFGPPSAQAPTAEGRFLRSVVRRLYDENVFSVVVTRFFDELHRDHIHLDLARYRVDGTR